MLPDNLASRIHFVWGDPEGAHDSFVPIYDLALVKRQPSEVIEMQELKKGTKLIINGRKAIIKEVIK